MSGYQSSSLSDGSDAASEQPGINFPSSASGGEHGEDVDVYQRLAQKERDLILAAELGKALLDSNQELQTQYDQTVEEYSLKVEELQQEKHGLHMELEKMEREYQNAIKDLQDDVASLQKQIREGAEQQVVEKESSRFLREAQRNIDYLMEQIKKATVREEELTAELNAEKEKGKSNSATVQDQMDHISMLREQVEYLSEKLKETNEKLEEVQSERDSLCCALEKAQEMLQVSEAKISQQNEKLHRQENQLEELQESNCELQQQVNHLQSTQHLKQQLRLRSTGHQLHRYNTLDSSSSGRIHKGEQSQALLKELSPQGVEQKEQKSRIPKMSQASERKNHKSLIFQRKPKSLSLEITNNKQQSNDLWSDGIVDTSEQKESQSISIVCSDHCDNTDNLLSAERTCGLNMEEEYLPMSDSDNHAEQSLFAELCNSLSEEQTRGSQAGSFKPTHHRNASDCSLSSLTEGSRKRQHENIRADSDGTDEDSPDRSGCKQTLYSQDKLNRLSHNSSFDNDVSGNLSKTTWGNNTHLTSWTSADDISDCVEDETIELSTYHLYSTAYDDLEPMSLQLVRGMSMGPPSCEDDAKELSVGPRMRDLSQFTELSPVSEFPPPSQENIAEQSLFSELSTQMGEDKAGSGSEGSPGCAMGVFDFSAGHSLQDGDSHSPATGMADHGPGPRLDTEMMNSGEWNKAATLPCDILEEDDFECDDDDFLVGNMEGTTLSIGGGGHNMLYYSSPNIYADAACSMPSEPEFLSFDTKSEESIRESHTETDVQKTSTSPCPTTQEVGSQKTQKINEACKQLRELVRKAHAGGLIASPKYGDDDTSTDTLLSLIAELRLCVESACTDKWNPDKVNTSGPQKNVDFKRG
ncbi:bicaudal D-related protein [Elysia marginata]|uniref:Bicaudal D-related protein n=1 Tax=Elysia marginata TaxID=1093978 RepID=A0AAV4H0K7_9GAST|nr:bicaudal D-related protein [Elysia marginata]